MNAISLMSLSEALFRNVSMPETLYGTPSLAGVRAKVELGAQTMMSQAAWAT